MIASRLSATEVLRAGRRGAHRRALQQAQATLDSFVFLEITPAILKRAASFEQTELRTLDAIHLATALSLDAVNLDFLTYDARLANAARAHGLSVAAPGAEVTDQQTTDGPGTKTNGPGTITATRPRLRGRR